MHYTVNCAPICTDNLREEFRAKSSRNVVRYTVRFGTLWYSLVHLGPVETIIALPEVHMSTVHYYNCILSRLSCRTVHHTPGIIWVCINY